MSEDLQPRSVAVLAGGGAVPLLVADAAARSGRIPVIFAIAQEADPDSFGLHQVHALRWGEIGRLFRLVEKAACHEAVFVGSIGRRPDFASLRPDLGGLKLMPRIVQLLRSGDDGVLSGVAQIFSDRGLRVVSPLVIAPELALPEGLLTGRISRADADAIAPAAAAARAIGSLDLGQAAVAVNGRVIALEDADGTDAMLDRVASMRRRKRIEAAGGVLFKAMKPGQDERMDLPTIGPATAEAAFRAGLGGVGGEAGRSLLAGCAETVEAFRRVGLFLFGMPRAS